MKRHNRLKKHTLGLAAGGRTDAGSFMIWQSVKECSKKGQKARKKRENLHRKSRKSACQAVPFLVS